MLYLVKEVYRLYLSKEIVKLFAQAFRVISLPYCLLQTEVIRLTTL